MNDQSFCTTSCKTVPRYALCLVVAAALLLICLFTPCETEAAEETLYVKVLVARVRQAPTTEAPILFKARRGDPVAPLLKQGEWYLIKHPNGYTGWAHEKLFTAVPSTEGETAGRNYFISSVDLAVVSDTEETVTFQLDSFHPPETFVLKGERPRVVCDFLNTRTIGSVGNRVEADGSLVRDIRIAPYGGLAPRVRVVLDLTPGRSYAIEQTFYKLENRYVVTVAAAAP